MEKSRSDIESVRILISLLVQKGIKEVVLSPGSRNAPLLVSVAREKRLKHHIIVDERSAAFFALGIAQQTRTNGCPYLHVGNRLIELLPCRGGSLLPRNSPSRDLGRPSLRMDRSRR